MRKYSLVIVLCLALVVGGVFAAWTYADGAIAEKTANPEFAIEGASNVTKGEISFEGAVALSIDQNGVKDYTGALKVTTDNLVVKFAPNDHLTTTPTLTWHLVGSVKINGNNEIITVKDATPVDLTLNNNQATITGSDIISKLNISVELADKKAYDDFVTAFESKQCNLKIVINEK